MIVSKMECVCPNCEENIKLDMNNIEMGSDGYGTVLTFECPKCKETITNEPIDLD